MPKHWIIMQNEEKIVFVKSTGYSYPYRHLIPCLFGVNELRVVLTIFNKLWELQFELASRRWINIAMHIDSNAQLKKNIIVTELVVCVFISIYATIADLAVLLMYSEVSDCGVDWDKNTNDSYPGANLFNSEMNWRGHSIQILKASEIAVVSHDGCDCFCLSNSLWNHQI